MKSIIEYVLKDKAIDWKYTVPVRKEQIQSVEKELGVKFPQVFIKFISRRNGGSPVNYPAAKACWASDLF